MKRILVYGDSNVWGYAKRGVRFSRRKQWPVILGKKLGRNYQVIQEGLPSRTAGSIDQYLPHLDGQAYFKQLLPSALPLDIVMISLGSNDIKPVYRQTVDDIVDSLLWYRQATRQLAPEARVVFLLPANYAPGQVRFRNDLRMKLIKRVQNIEGLESIIFEGIDLDDYVHYSKKGHRQVARIVSNYIKSNTQKPD